MKLIINLFTSNRKNDPQEIIQSTLHLILCMHEHQMYALIIDFNENIYRIIF